MTPTTTTWHHTVASALGVEAPDERAADTPLTLAGHAAIGEPGGRA